MKKKVEKRQCGEETWEEVLFMSRLQDELMRMPDFDVWMKKKVGSVLCLRG